MFRNRIEAGILLAEKLRKYQGHTGLILAVPRGGVPVTYAVARELGLPVEIVLTKKISHPLNREYAIGAASLSDYFIIPHENVTEQYIQKELKNIRARLQEMYHRFMGNESPQKIEGKTVIVIDDGIATGNTVLGTLHLLKKGNPAKIIVAAPVASAEAVRKLSAEADEIVTVTIPDHFYGVGAYYEDFSQLTDTEVITYLEKLKALRNAE